ELAADFERMRAPDVGDRILILVGVLNASLRQDGGGSEIGGSVLEENLGLAGIVYERGKDGCAPAIGSKERIHYVGTERVSLSQRAVPWTVCRTGSVLGEIRIDECKSGAVYMGGLFAEARVKEIARADVPIDASGIS